jgi:predicted Zn-dependent peptidase
MRSVRLTFFLLVIIALPLPAQQVEVIEHELENGIQILMVQRPGDPSVAAGWVAHVGSVNERPGITGMAHLFEHMMFKGTRTIGTKDYAADRRIMEEKDSLRTLMREEESEMRAMQRRGLIDDIRDPDNWTDRYKELESEIRALIEEQREIIVKDELDRIYSMRGRPVLMQVPRTISRFTSSTFPPIRSSCSSGSNRTGSIIRFSESSMRSGML